MDLRAVWAATGNNVQLSGDGIARRVTYVRLESPEENPEDRTDFRIKDLRGHVREHRAELLGAALTILRGYCAADRPDMSLPPWGGFEGWSALNRTAVVWAAKTAARFRFAAKVDLPDPALGRLELRETAVPEMAALPALLDGIEFLDRASNGGECLGVTASHILEASGRDTRPIVKALHDALVVLCPSRDGKVNPRSLGMKLHHLRGRVVGGRRVERIGNAHHGGGATWRVVVVAPVGGGTRGLGGTSSSPSPKKYKQDIPSAIFPQEAGSSPPKSPSTPKGQAPNAAGSVFSGWDESTRNRVDAYLRARCEQDRLEAEILGRRTRGSPAPCGTGRKEVDHAN
jgi:hypothetical protein